MKISLLAIALLWASGGTHHFVSASDPSTYFGGTDQDEYTAWLDTTCYDKSAFIESTQEPGAGVAVHWTIQDGDSIQLGVAARASGWVGFGIGESGSMLGADMVLFSAASNTLIDSYVLDQAVMPLRDECQSWTLINSMMENGFIIFEATRLLDTGDAQDRVLADESDPLVPSTRVLAAWGETSEPSFHAANNARGAIRFFGNRSTSNEIETFAAAMNREAEGNFTVRANGFIIPTVRTTYQNFCVIRDDLLAMNVPLDQDLHTIGVEAFIDPRTRAFVHHYTVAGSTAPQNASTFSCGGLNPSFETVYVWAPGDVPFNFPAHIGGPLGPNGFQSFKLEIHYDNPSNTSNLTDDSGIRLYYTSKKREFDMGVFSTGDPVLSMMGDLVSPNQGLAQHVFDCPGSCSANYTTGPLTVIREHLHMHGTGVSMLNAQIRNGQVIREGGIEYWDFNQQGNYVVTQPAFTMEPGDSFRTICNYYADNNETWGQGSDNEMCVAFLYYYPRQVIPSPIFGSFPFVCGVGIGNILPGCEASYEFALDVVDTRQLDRVFGTLPDNATGYGTCAVSTNVSLIACPGEESSVNNTDGSMSNATDGLTFNITDGLTFNITDGSTSNATDGSTSNATDGSTSNVTDGSTSNATDGSTSNATDGSTNNATDGVTNNDTDGAASNATDGAASNTTDGVTNNATDGATSNATDGVTSNVTDGATSSSTNGTIGSTSNATNGSARNATNGSSAATMAPSFFAGLVWLGLATVW